MFIFCTAAPKWATNLQRFKMKTCHFMSSCKQPGRWCEVMHCPRILISYPPSEGLEGQRLCENLWVHFNNKQDRNDSTEQERKEETHNRWILLWQPAYCFNRWYIGSTRSWGSTGQEYPPQTQHPECWGRWWDIWRPHWFWKNTSLHIKLSFRHTSVQVGNIT